MQDDREFRLALVLESKGRMRLRVHYGSEMEVKYALQNFGIQSARLQKRMIAEDIVANIKGTGGRFLQ